MERKETSRERIERINKEFDALLNHKSISEKSIEPSSPKELLKFGLNLSEAKAWLKREPDYLSDGSYHEPRNRRKVNRTIFFGSVNLIGR